MGQSARLKRDLSVESASPSSAPQRVVSMTDAIALTVGIVIGAGIFRTPSVTAANASSESMVYFAWTLGGVVSLIGALVYAELATTYPHAGGDYHYLTRAFGRRLSFLFAWARMSVIQTGSIALVSFVFGDYVGQILPLGEYSSSIYATLTVVVLTALNILGVREGTGTQRWLTTIQVLGIIVLIIAGLAVAAPSPDPAGSAPNPSTPFSSLGLMMVFILLTYGGWNETVYVSAELRNVQRNMSRVLILSMLVITVLYVSINWAYLHALGLAGTAQSEQVASDVMRRALGTSGATIISLLVAISALTTVNATVFTGARTSYAFGRDFKQFGFLGRWNPRTSTPVNALLVQGAVALALVILGTLTRKRFETIVEYTAPVFWFFFLLTGIAFFVLRRKEPRISRPFHVPFYPVTPILFCLTCAYLLYSSLAYTGVGALVGVAVLVVGFFLLLFISPLASNTSKHEGES